jgi:1-acyl-sn-glycerol-3-phosphate acyltransferase
MRSNSKSFLYWFLRPIVGLGSRLFFRRIEVVGLENVPDTGAVILVANHQNAMLDPVMCCIFTPRQLHWLTRADVFVPGKITQLLRAINMMPVYRERDSVKDIRDRNQRTFEECYARLKNDAMVCLFPEGTHRGKKSLHPLKKGLARLADGALEKGLDKIVLLPVGLDYGDYYHSRSTLLIRFGRAVKWAEISDIHEPDASRNLQKSMDEVRHRLSEEMIDIQVEENYHMLMVLEPLIHGMYPQSLNHGFEVFQKVCGYFEASSHHSASFRGLVQRYEQLSRQMHLNDGLLSEKVHRPEDTWLNPFLLLAGGVASIPAMFFFAPMHAIIEHIVDTRIKDRLFYNSIRLVIWTFGAPLYLLLAAVVAGTFWGKDGWWYSLLCITISGIIALKVWFPFRSWWMRMRLRRQRKTNPGLYQEWTELRAVLGHHIAEIANA